jgi:uncharacterized lipoprotein YehR (DUF1307 family)
MRKTVWSMTVVAVLALGSLSLTGCGQSMSGKYAGDFLSVEFKSGSKAYITVGQGGATTEVTYRIDGDKIIFQNQAGNVVLTRNKDGSLSGGPMNETLKKIN